MGAEGAVNIMSSVKKELAEADDPEALRKQRIDEYEELFNNPYYAAGLGYVDDVIEGYLYEGDFYEDAQHTELITAWPG